MKILDKSGNTIYESQSDDYYEVLQECTQNNINLQNADFKGQEFKTVAFENLDLKGADFSNSNFEDCHFVNCNLCEANFSSCYLELISFQDNLCTQTIFDDIELDILITSNFKNTFYQCSFQRAILENCDFRNCSFEECDLSEVNISNAIGDMKQICSLQVDSFKIAFTKDIIAIGCKNESLEWWKNASDDLITDERNNYADTWNAYKDILFEIINIKFGG